MIEVTEESDASHALVHEPRRDVVFLSDVRGMRRQKKVLAVNAIVKNMCDGDHTTRNFRFAVSVVTFLQKSERSSSSRIQ